MGLESATYISDLTATNPLANDPEGQGDDHLRLIKSCLKASLPNADRAEYFQGVVAITGDTTVGSSADKTLYAVSTAAGNVVVTLPTLLAANDGWEITVMKTTADLNAISVVPAAGTINSLASVAIQSNWQAFTFVWTGSAWALKQNTRMPPVNIMPVTADATLTNLIFGSLVEVTTSSVIVTVTLPTAVGYKGKSVFLQRIGATYGVVVEGAGSETINGALNYTIPSDKAIIWLMSDGANWKTLLAFSGSTGAPAYLDIAQAWTATQTYNAPVAFGVQTLVDAAPVVWNMSVNRNAKLTMTASRTISAPTGETTGAEGYFDVLMDSTGGWVLTWNAAYTAPGGGRPDSPSATANATTRYRYQVRGADDIIVTKEFVSDRSFAGFYKEFDLGLLSAGNSFSQAHSFGKLPGFVVLFAKCTTIDGNFAVNDYVHLSDGNNSDSGSGDYSYGVNVTMNATTVYVDHNGIIVKNRGSSGGLVLAGAKWHLIIRVFG